MDADHDNPFREVDDKLDLIKNQTLRICIEQSEVNARTIVEAANIRGKILVLVGTVVMPLVWSAFTAFVDPSEHKLWFWAILTALLISMYWVFSRITRMQAPENAFFMLKDLQKLSVILRDSCKKYHQRNTELKEQVVYLDASVEALSNALSQSAIQVDKVLSGSVPKNHKEFSAMLRTILEPLCRAEDFMFTFGIRDKAKIMLTLYFWDEQQQLLKIAYRETNWSKIKQKHRSWGKRQGFAGTVFADKKTIIENGVGTGLNPNGSFQVDGSDREHYRSAIGVPIIASNDEYASEKDPIGVIVMTSSVDQTFRDDVGAGNRYESVLLATARFAAMYLDFLESQTENEDMGKLIFGE